MADQPASSSTAARPRRPHRARWYAAGFATAALVLGMPASAVTTKGAAPARGSSHHGVHREVMANLFEWNWDSVANECTTVLGPKGYGGVQVSPPQDSLKRQHLGDGSDTILHPWWEVYQAVDYHLTSRMGSEADFRSMVRTCRSAGVKVYVDAVINHMTGQGDTSYGGVKYERYHYTGLYNQDDFHKYSGDCPSASGGIEDFNNLQQVRNCELVGLADLRTDTDRVRTRLAAYLNKLIRYGVSGFRVDAAKHIGQPDLDAIRARLHRTVDGTRPYWALEVFGGGPGTLSPQAFTRSGSVLGLDAVKQLRDAFKSYPDAHVGSIATLRDFGAGSGLTPSRRTLSFVQNHDTERNGDALSYKDGARNILANEYLLASGYGRPQVYSGFAFTTNDDSPPATSDGMVTDTNCDKGWVCVDRDPGVEALVGFHNHVGWAPQRHWWDDGANVIAFSRGSRGWVAFNNGTADKKITVGTGLRRGVYCDAVSGGRAGGSCAGTIITVDSSGRATVTVPVKGALAIDWTDRL
jgi:alpha-amylase